MSAIGNESAVPVEGAPAETTTTTEPSGYDAVMDRVGQLSTGFEGLRNTVQEFVQAQQPAPEVEAEPDWWAQAFGIEPPPAEAQPVAPQFNPDAFQQAVQREADQRVEQRVGPIAQQLQQMQQAQALNTIYTQLPHLADKPGATPEETQQIKSARTELAGMVQQRIAGYTPDVQAALAADPNFIVDTFRAAEAMKLAAAQTPAGGIPPAQLEAAGGAHPGGSGEQPSIVHEAMANRVSLPKGFR